MKDADLINDLRQVINRNSIENRSNTPDYILAEYLYKCLISFEEASNAREKWFGKKLEIGTSHI